MKRLFGLGLMIVIASAAGVHRADAQTGQKRMDIKIYLLDRFEQDGVTDANDLFPVDRKMDGADHVRAAMHAFMSGPTADEMETLKLYSTADGINLVSVRRKGKTVRVNFTAEDLDLVDPADGRIFRLAVERTLRQFRSVRKVEVCLDGIANFDRKNARRPVIKCR